ncbi:MAG TPA: PQQ-binding-like beta-propeller repeat protein [Fimbriiglobus sp.]|nr:PQQ-binding-like beta-propeller repeat protein [Fimbriiglobus sp.]
MAPLPTVLAVLCLAPAAELSVKPTDWPQFRGPNRDGVSTETGLLKKWPEGGPPKVWTATGLGGGYGSVSVVGGLIFGTGEKDGKEYVWALDEATGEQKWATPFADAPRVPGGYDEGPRSAPTYAAGKVYAVGQGGVLACLDATNGKLVWSKSYAKDFGGSMQTWAYSESVLVDDGKVIGTPGSASAAMVALNPDTGAVIWKTPVARPGGAGGYASPVKAEVGGVPMYINLLGQTGGVIGVHAKTGKLLWQYTRVMNGTANIPSPVVSGDLVFTSTGYGAGAALLRLVPSAGGVRVEELKAYTGERRGPQPAVQNHHGGMLPVGGHIYFGSGHNQGVPACVNFATGEVKWTAERSPRGGDGSAATAAADGMLYFRYQNGLMALIKADPEKFELVSSFQLPERSRQPSWPHPSIANGKLYIRDQDKLLCFDVKAK